MTTGDERRVLSNLQDLLSRDLSTVELDELVAGVKEAEATRDRAAVWSGRLVAELHARTGSWRVVRELTGLTQGTAGRRKEAAEAQVAPTTD